MKKIAVIGFGEMGKRHARDMEEHSRCELEIGGVYEPDDAKYRLGCEWLGKEARRFASPEQLLSELDPDGIIIASPNFCHLENLRMLKGRKIPVILEKPLDSSFEKICDVIRFVASYDAPVMVHHVMRYSPIVKKAKEIIESGTLGKVCSFHFSQTIGGHMWHNFRRNMKTGGGQLIEKATHDFDVLLHWCNSNPKRVAAICKRQRFGGDMPDDLHCNECSKKMSCDEYASGFHVARSNFKDVNLSNNLCCYAKCADVFDNETCLIELENGVFGTYTNTYFVENYFTRVYEVIGTEAIMRVGFSKLNGYEGEIELRGRHIKANYSFAYEDRIHYNGAPGVATHFYNLICGNEKIPYSPVDQAFSAEMIALAAYKANETGTYINVKDLVPEDLKKVFAEAYK
ncbi:MAG: hypothetical protein A2020_06550 [Lentisphaerae bacterium GWF2_45_14]|nr:MAG: hypothetical protein A2020_06550 [Lentisphaerae bacterium GWF2_45_14]